MSEGRLRGSMGRWAAMGDAVWGGVGAGLIGLLAACTPPAPIIKYSGPRLHVRTPAASIRVFPSGVPDRGYLETGTVEIYCTVENNSGALGSVSQSAGCPYEQALILARQHASDVGADGIFSIITNPAANGNIAMMRATAFRYSSMGEEFPELSATVQRVPVAPEPPQAADSQPPAVQPEPASEPSAVQDALPSAQPQLPVYTPHPVPVQAPVANQTPTLPRPPALPKQPAIPKQPLPVPALSPPPATASRPTPAPAAARPSAPAKPTVVVPPPAPTVEVPVQTAAGAATLLPAAERLQRLKELRDKRMIPAEMFERRKKELMLEMQKSGGQ